MRKLSWTTYLLIGLISFSLIGSATFISLRIRNSVKINENDYTPHEPITIFEDRDFDEYNFPGEGTKINPYKIEGFNITTEEEYGIHIKFPKKYFIIQDCYIDSGYYGIVVLSAKNGTATITNNICKNNNDGIYVGDSNGALIKDNRCEDNTRYSIWISSESKNVVVKNNICINNKGIQLSSTCSNITIKNNEITNGGFRISGLEYANFLTYSIKSNKVNGRKLGYFVNQNKFVIKRKIYGQLILASCNEVEIFNQDFKDTFCTCGLILQNCNNISIHDITSINSGIHLLDCQNASISNSFCTNSWKGIYTENCRNVKINDNTLTENSHGGIHFRYSRNTLVWNNICNNSGVGIISDWSHCSNVTNNFCYGNEMFGIEIRSHNNIVSQNYCVNNSNGIYSNGDDIEIVENLCIDNIRKANYTYPDYNSKGFGIISNRGASIIRNNCSFNKYGIGISDCGDGEIYGNYISENIEAIILTGSSFWNILNNTIESNSANGITVKDSPGDYWVGPINSTHNTIIYNNIKYNTKYGIKLSNYTKYNIIHHNNFIGNNFDSVSQALDNGISNIWFDNQTNEGNFWSDYNGLGNYSISGISRSNDTYPLIDSVFIVTKEIETPIIIIETESSSFAFLVFFLSFFVIILIARLTFKRRRKYYSQI